MKRNLILISLLSVTILNAGDTNINKSITTSKVMTRKLTKKQEGIKYIKILAKTLKSNLKAQFKADKTALKAIKFCANKAAELTKVVNSNLPKNVKVRRTALLLRNEANKPDALDKAIMQKIILDMNKTSIKVSKPLLVEIPSGYRVYKPLFIKPVCLKCHGSSKDISPEVRKIIASKYPNDKAVGYKVGDFRGVIVSEITKEHNQ